MASGWCCVGLPAFKNIAGGVTTSNGMRITKMNLDAILGLALSALLLVYLACALLRPEKF